MNEIHILTDTEEVVEVLDSEQEAAGYDYGNLNTTSFPDNKNPINDHKKHMKYTDKIKDIKVSKDKFKKQKSDNENKNKIPGVPEKTLGVVRDAVLDAEQVVAVYDYGDLEAAFFPENKVHVNDHKIDKFNICTDKIKDFLKISAQNKKATMKNYLAKV